MNSPDPRHLPMTSFDPLTALLDAEPSQGSRLLRLTTPLGPDRLIAERLELDEAVGPSAELPSGLAATLYALSTDAHLELKSLIGQPACIGLALADGSLRSWHSHIMQACLEGSDGGLARYRLTLQPWLAALGHRTDSWVFQDLSVPEIVDQVFADYLGHGRLAPSWRWELADASLYPRRSLCVQYQETDLQFVLRLLEEEGMFFWWEHQANFEADASGLHTLVLADHNAAFQRNLGAVRYTQAGLGLAEDSLDEWASCRRVATSRVAWASPDYRSLGLRPLERVGQGLPDGLEMQTVADLPGPYAYPSPDQGERLLTRSMEALDAHRQQLQAAGTLRRAAPGCTFTLVEHPLHDGRHERDDFAILSVSHRAISNLHADVKARLLRLSAAMAAEAEGGTARQTATHDGDEPVYRCDLRLQPLSLPVRRRVLDEDGQPEARLWPQPTVQGVQTAIVVGAEGAATDLSPVFTDRDHRIRVQFHWQRGEQSGHGLLHPAGCNAPGSAAIGTWVRVLESTAGANWGSVFTPRVGQEVLVAFLGGCIDRPVVIGSVYNGQGLQDQQANLAHGGAAGAAASTPAWFPGSQQAGSEPSDGRRQAKSGGSSSASSSEAGLSAAPDDQGQGHRHAAVMAGFKSQELCTTTTGSGGFNQLVVDDTPGEGRLELATSLAQTRLQLGHLLHQPDNRRLAHRGHGVDLVTAAWGAVRAAQGVLVSAHRKEASAQTLDLREPRSQVDLSRSLLHALAESAQQHGARLDGGPDVAGAGGQQTPSQLGAERALRATQDSLAGTEERRGAAPFGAVASAEDPVGGGDGLVTALGRPDLVLAAPGGIVFVSPGPQLMTSGGNLCMTTGQDLQQLSQTHFATVARQGLVLYTHGHAEHRDRPNLETGITLHAASGSVNFQSQTGALQLTAAQRLEVMSTKSLVRVCAPQHVMLTAAGAALQVEGGEITLSGPGKVEFKAGLKELSAGSSLHAVPLKLPRPPALALDPAPKPQARHVLLSDDEGFVLAGRPYRIWLSDGRVIDGISDADGLTEEVETDQAAILNVEFLKKTEA